MSLELWEDVIKFNDKHFPNWRDIILVYYSNALAGEVGEVCNLVKHKVGGGTNNDNPSEEKIIEELVDVNIYLILLAERLGFDHKKFVNQFYKKLVKLEIRMLGISKELKGE